MFVFNAMFITIMGTIVVPFVAQWLKKESWSRAIKFLVTVGLCLLTGGIGYVASGFALAEFAVVAKGVFILAISSYTLWWKKVFEESVTMKSLGLRK